MTNIHKKAAGSAPRSSKWLRASSEGAQSALHVIKTAALTIVRQNETDRAKADDPARVSASISSSFISCPRPEIVRTGVSPMTRPGSRRDPRILMFPARRAPNRDGGEGAGGQGTSSGPMSGMSVLVVEDEFIVAYDMQMLLEEQGARVIGPASTLAEAQQLLKSERPDLAVLDVNLNGEYVFPLLSGLRQQNVPFVFATAYADEDKLFPEEARSVPRLAKPVLPNVLIGQLMRLKR